MGSIPISIEYRLKFETPFHIGTGRGAGLIDKLVRRDGKGFLYIPGSMMKGYIRENAERLLNIGLFKYVEYENCYHELFGEAGKEGTLFFDSLKMIKEQRDFFCDNDRDDSASGYKYMQIQIRTGNKINRKVGRAEEKMLFSQECGIFQKPKPLCFEGIIWGVISDETRLFLEDWAPSVASFPPELFLLYCALKMTDKVGAGKTTGFGKCQLTINKMLVGEEDVSEPDYKRIETLKEALNTSEELRMEEQ